MRHSSRTRTSSGIERLRAAVFGTGFRARPFANRHVRRGIATDVEEAWARYTADIKDPAMMSDEFVDAFYHLLASAMAMPLVDSASMQQTNYQLAQMAVQAAKWENMVESAKRTRYPHGYSDAQFR